MIMLSMLHFKKTMVIKWVPPALVSTHLIPAQGVLLLSPELKLLLIFAVAIATL